MAKWRDFSPGVPLPSTWTDGVEELLSTVTTANFTVEKQSNTILRVPAGTGQDQVAIMIEKADGSKSSPRWITTNITATHPGGTLGIYDVYVTSTADSFGTGGGGETDITTRAFGLKIVAAAATPSGSGSEAYYRKVATCFWDGAVISNVVPLVGGKPNRTQPITPNATTTGETPVDIRGVAGQTADLLRVGIAGSGDMLALNANAQLKLPAQGSNGGLLIGADAQWYRSATNTMRTPGKLVVDDTSTLTGDTSIGGNLLVTGVASGITVAVDTNTTQFATTAFVLAQAASTAPLVNDVVAAVGTSTRYARSDHVHPGQMLTGTAGQITVASGNISLPATITQAETFSGETHFSNQKTKFTNSSAILYLGASEDVEFIYIGAGRITLGQPDHAGVHVWNIGDTTVGGAVTVGRDDQYSGSLGTGTGTYSAVFGSQSARSTHLISNNVVRLTFGGAGELGLFGSAAVARSMAPTQVRVNSATNVSSASAPAALTLSSTLGDVIAWVSRLINVLQPTSGHGLLNDGGVWAS